MTEIKYQSYDSATDRVDSGTVTVDGNVTYEKARAIAQAQHSDSASIDLLSVVREDGSDLIAELEEDEDEL